MRGLAAAQGVLAGERAPASAWRAGLDWALGLPCRRPQQSGVDGEKQSGGDGGGGGSMTSMRR